MEAQKGCVKLLNIFQKYITNTKICRQTMIEHYFDTGNLSLKKSNEKCGKCDNCLGLSRDIENTMLTDVTKESKTIIRLVEYLPVNYGVTKLIEILKGTESKDKNNSFFGKGNHMSIDWWKKLINELVLEDYLSKKTFSYYIVIGLGDKELSEEKIKLYIDDKNKKSRDYQSTHFKKYKKIRDHLAKINMCAPYMIINDKVLSNITQTKPKTVEELYNIDGVSNDFICKYGQYFIEKKKINPNEYDCCTIYVATDGYENASKKYTNETMKTLIEQAKTFKIEIFLLSRWVKLSKRKILFSHFIENYIKEKGILKKYPLRLGTIVFVIKRHRR